MANAQLSNEPKNVQNGDLEMNQRHQNNLMKYLRHPVYRCKIFCILKKILNYILTKNHWIQKDSKNSQSSEIRVFPHAYDSC